MADKQISDLTAASGMTDGSLFVIEQSSTAKNINWGKLKNYISPGVAPLYSNSSTYAVGDYVIYNDQLYRCTTAITTAEAWTAAHWTAAVLGDDVEKSSKMAAVGYEEVTITAYPYTSCVIRADNTILRSSSKYRSRQVTPGQLWSYIVITANSSYDSIVAFLTGTLATTPTSGTNISSMLATGETGRHIIDSGKTEILPIPSDCTNILIAYTNNSNDCTPSSVKGASELFAKVSDVDAVPLKSSSKFVQSGGVRSTLNSVAEETGAVYFWGENGSVADTGANTGAERINNTIKLNNSTGQTTTRNSFPLSTDVFSRTTNSTGLEGLPKDLALKAGHTYRIKSELVSGTLDTSDGAYCTVRLRDSSNNELISESSDYYGIAYNSEAIYTATSDISCLLVLSTSSAFTATDAVIKVTMVDMTVATANILATEDTAIPSYYFSNDYLKNKLSTITTLRNTMSANADEFFFVADYHHQYNTGHSYDLIKYISERTGINKLFFCGDAGGARGTTESAVFNRFQLSTKVWNDLSNCVPLMYGTLGNHEFIHSPMTLAANEDAYLGRYKMGNTVMDITTGAYYVDNTANKIRYFFIQDNNSAAPVDGSIAWFGAALGNVPSGYAVALTVHHAYIPSSATYDEYDGVTITYNYTSIKAMSQLLHAYMVKGSFTYSGVTYDYSSLTGDRPVIGIFCGHLHHGFMYTGSTETGIEGINVFRGSTDCMHAGTIAVDDKPWYWEDGIVGGTKVVRASGTVLEQCVYVVQVDLDNGKLYVTTIGGDHDWVADF